MNWLEMLEAAGKKPLAVMATATTGLSQDDETMAVGWRAYDTDTREWVVGSVYRNVDSDKLMASQEYHQISVEYLRANACDDEQFRLAVQDVFAGHVVLTYNPAFQRKYLEKALGTPVPMYNLPAILKGANVRAPLDDVDTASLETIEAYCLRIGGKPGSLTKVTAQYRVEGLMPPALPFESAAYQLLGLLKVLPQIPVVVQGTLL